MLNDDVTPIVLGFVVILAVCWAWDWYQNHRK
jgi:predicted negative regulator of RcsB-dependent stress response